ncbi:MAG TPA: ABC transporter permease [Candidatus Angelobacter sp.]|nr:ABC transporter permease [Candidatus Angelobacter sp.]
MRTWRRFRNLFRGNPSAARAPVGDTPLAGIWRDLRYTARQLRRSPSFTATAVVTLALGIGATTAIFTLIEQVMLRSLAVAQPDHLWRIGDSDSCCFSSGYTQGKGNGDFLPQNNWNFFSWEAYNHLRSNTPAFENLAAFQVGEYNAYLVVRPAGSSTPVEMRNGEYVSGNFFETFGISPWRGRLFTDADDREGAPPVAVMSFRIWRAKYGSDPSVAGATYEINGHLFTVVGVAPPGFFGAKIDTGNMPDFWLTLATEPLMAGATSRLKNPRLAWLDLIGRVRPGTNPQSLEAKLNVELHQWLRSHAPDMTSEEKALLDKQTLRLTPGGAGVSPMREKYKSALWLLLLAAACVLLVACANIANLLLARGLKDRPQTALRAALGAPRARLVRKALGESLSLAVIGGAGGIALAYAGARLILHLAFGHPDTWDTWVPVDATPSSPVLLFALAVSVITGLIFGIAPAWMTSHAEPIEAIRGHAEGVNRGVAGSAWAQKMLVIVQAAVSLVLLSAAAMLGQSLRNLEQQNFGFDSQGRYLVSISPKISNYKQEQLVPLVRDIEDQLRLIPGVHKVGSVVAAPQTSWVWPHDIRVEGKPEPGPEDDVSSGWTRVTPGFLDTLGDRILMGRPITDEDTATTAPVAVVNEAFAKRFFGRENPIGQHFGPAPRNNAGMYEIVGVLSDVDFGNGRQPMYFLPEAQSTNLVDREAEEREVLSHYLGNVLIWAPGNPAGLQAEVKKTLANAAPNLVVYGIQPYQEVVRAKFAQQNMIASLTWLFGAVGLLLAAVGLYGVTSYGVEQRTSEIGVRMALGADRGNVVGMVLGTAFWQVGIGVALGIPAAIAAGWAIASQLFGVDPWNPAMLGFATVLLVLTALLAAAIPARRAAAVDPMRALRTE